ncbi:hypothetical protein ES702_02803 [subsurface metagenome]
MTEEVLDPDRVREMFWLFSKVLPMGETDEEINKQVFGATVSQLLPEIAQTIGHSATKNLELLNEYFDFIVHAISYCRNEIDSPPPVDCDPEMIMKYMKESQKEFDKIAK